MISPVDRGLRNGFVAGFWAIIPGVLLLINAENESDFSLLLDFAILMLVFPAILFVCCLLSSRQYGNGRNKLITSAVCGVFGMICVNFIFQIFYIIYTVANEIELELHYSDLINFQEIITGLLIGIFSFIMDFLNKPAKFTEI